MATKTSGVKVYVDRYTTPCNLEDGYSFLECIAKNGDSTPYELPEQLYALYELVTGDDFYTPKNYSTLATRDNSTNDFATINVFVLYRSDDPDNKKFYVGLNEAVSMEDGTIYGGLTSTKSYGKCPIPSSRYASYPDGEWYKSQTLFGIGYLSNVGCNWRGYATTSTPVLQQLTNATHDGVYTLGGERCEVEKPLIFDGDGEPYEPNLDNSPDIAVFFDPVGNTADEWTDVRLMLPGQNLTSDITGTTSGETAHTGIRTHFVLDNDWYETTATA